MKTENSTNRTLSAKAGNEQSRLAPVSGCAIPVIVVMYNDFPWLVEELHLSYDYNNYACFKGFKPKYWAEEIDRDNTIDSIIQNTGLYWEEKDETNYKATIEILDAIIAEHEKVKNSFRQKYDKSLSLHFIKHCH